VDFEFRHETIQVGADRVRREPQPHRDLFAPGTLKQIEQNIPFARRESREQLIAAAAVVLIIDQQAQHLA
jgi:hypothetical protein